MALAGVAGRPLLQRAASASSQGVYRKNAVRMQLRWLMRGAAYCKDRDVVLLCAAW